MKRARLTVQMFSLLIINPQRACTARVTVVVPCVCMCVCPLCSFLPPHASRLRNIGKYGFTVTRKKFYNSVFDVVKNSLFRSYCVICLPLIPLTTPEPQNTDTNGICTRGHDISIRDFN